VRFILGKLSSMGHLLLHPLHSVWSARVGDLRHIACMTCGRVFFTSEGL